MVAAPQRVRRLSFFQPSCHTQPMDFDLSPRRALAALTPDDLPLWHVCYCPQEGLEMRPRATLANVERDLRAAGDDSRPLLRVLVRAGRL